MKVRRILSVLAVTAAFCLSAQEPSRVIPRQVLPAYQVPPRAADLSADDVQKLERQVAATPEDMWARRTLLEYYYSKGMRTARLPHVYWIIEHHPDDEIMASGFCDLPPDTVLATRSDYEYGRSLWLSQVARTPQNVRVRQNAARYFEPYDLQLALDNLTAALQADGNIGVRAQLARLYAKILDASAAPPMDPGARVYAADPQLVTRIKSDLEATNDAQLLASVSSGLRDRELADKLIARARVLNPDAFTPRAPAVAVMTGQIRVGGNVQASKLVRQPRPEYPALAKQARIQGMVRFNVVINKDGTMKNLTLVSGHPLLVPPAQEAVRQWVYQPTLLNGEPVEVVTTIDVNFTLSDSNAIHFDPNALPPPPPPPPQQ